MRSGALGVGRQITILDGAAQVGVGEAEQPATADDAVLGGEVERRPCRLGRVEQIEQLGLRQPVARSPDGGEHVSRQVRTVALEIGLIARQDELEQVVDGRCRRQTVEQRSQCEVIAVLTQLVEHGAQEAGVARFRRCHQCLEMLAVEGFAGGGQHGDGDLTTLVGRQRGHLVHVPSAMLDRSSRARRAGGEHEPHVRRNLSRQPPQVGSAVDVVEAVDTVDHDQRPARAGAHRRTQRAADRRHLGTRQRRTRGVDVAAGRERCDQTRCERPVIGRLGVGIDVVHEHSGLGIAFGPGAHPIRHRGRDTHARLAGDQQRRVVADGVGIEHRRHLRPLDVKPEARLPEGVVDGRPALAGILRSRLREAGLDDTGEIGEDRFAERHRVGIVDGRKPAVADSSAQRRQPLDADRRFLPVHALLVGRQAVDPRRVAQVEEGVPCRLGVVEDAVHDLELGHRAARVVGEPTQPIDQIGRDLIGHPPVTLTEQADEVRTRAIDLGQADRQHGALRLLLVGHAPTQIDLAPRHTALLAHPSQSREDPLHELVTLELHVSKRRRHEHPDRPLIHDANPASRYG
jgi:hypothetical protein